MSEIKFFDVLINKVKESSLDSVKSARQSNFYKFPFCRDLDYGIFRKSIEVIGKSILTERNSSDDFIIDDTNESTIKGLFYFITGHTPFNRGVFLTGSFGTGKTTLMIAYMRFIEILNEQRNYPLKVKIATSFEICNNPDKTVDKYKRGLLFIDDVGREPAIVKDYGNDRSPLVELLTTRYNTGEVTFLTSNYKLSTFKERYGEYTFERMTEMFYPMIMSGRSRRLK